MKQRLTLKDLKEIAEKQDYIVPTEDPILDYIIGGGIPYSLTVIAGTPGSGKTTLALFFAKILLQKEFKVWYFDMEKQLNPKWVVNILTHNQKEIDYEDNFIVYVPQHFEDMVFMINKDIFGQGGKKSKENILKRAFIWDSVAGTPLKSEAQIIEKTTGKTDLLKEISMTGLARVLSVVLKQFITKLTYLGIPCIAINQFRQKINFGVKSFDRSPKNIFGERGNTPGGFALKHHAYTYIEAVRGKSEKDIGFWVHLRVLKNKQNRPMETEYFFSYDYGFDTYLNLTKLAIKDNLIEKSGGWYKWGDKNYRLNELIDYIMQHEEEKLKIKELVLNSMNIEEKVKLIDVKEEDEDNIENISEEEIIIEE